MGGCITGILLACLWWVCLALLITGRGSGILLILATVTIGLWLWSGTQNENDKTSCH